LATEPHTTYPIVVQIPLKNSCILIMLHISTATEQFVACETFHSLKKVCRNPSTLLELSAQAVNKPLSHNCKISHKNSCISIIISLPL